jgi:hypothetical protein
MTVTGQSELFPLIAELMLAILTIVVTLGWLVEVVVTAAAHRIPAWLRTYLGVCACQLVLIAAVVRLLVQFGAVESMRVIGGLASGSIAGKLLLALCLLALGTPILTAIAIWRIRKAASRDADQRTLLASIVAAAADGRPLDELDRWHVEYAAMPDLNAVLAECAAQVGNDPAHVQEVFARVLSGALASRNFPTS